MKFIKLFIITLLFSTINTFAQSASEILDKGFDYYHNGNYSAAVDCFRIAAEQGDVRAQYWLGGCYYFGVGVEQNYTEAVIWYRKAAEQGQTIAQSLFQIAAQNSLGNCYYNGYGIDRNYTEAVKWYRKAADQGLAMAQYLLGSWYV